MEPSVACKHCSENSQAAIVPQQDAEGSANAWWDGGYYFEGGVHLNESLNAMIFEFKLKNSLLKNEFL